MAGRLEDRPDGPTRKDRKVSLGSMGRWKIALAVMFFFLFGGELVLLIRSERTQMLARRAQRIAARLMDFAQDRAQLMQRNPKESLPDYENRISAVNSETQSLYARQFYGQVAQLRDEFA